MLKNNTPTLLVFFLLTALCGIIIYYPHFNFQYFLSQGDHGRDLYAASAVLRGELPYRDFWWVYGPLMPYYYGLFFKFLGVHVPSILIGKIILNVLAGLGVFMAMSRFFSPAASFMAGIWFLVYRQDFFFTYNHAGGILFGILCIWMHFAYIKNQKISSAYWALFFTFILGTIKINFALTALVMGLITVIAVRRLHKKPFDTHEKIFITISFLGLPVLWFGVYSFFLQGLTVSEIRQCLPYLGGDEPYNKLGIFQTLPQLFQIILGNIRATYISMGLCALIVLCAIQTCIVLYTSKNKTLLFIILYALLLYVFNLHEFLKSGVFYRLFWSQPLSILLTFIVIGTSAANLTKPFRILLWSTLFIIAVNTTWQSTHTINTFKKPAQYLGSNRGHVYITNDRFWLQTVVLTTKELNARFKRDQSFLALPYDCLYYYLTDKKAPTRQLIFFDHIKISLEQEQRIIQELEKTKIEGIVLSSRQVAKEPGLGSLGITHCPMIGQYINTNFVPATKFGDWSNEPGWAWNHGTYIFNRKEKTNAQN